MLSCNSLSLYRTDNGNIQKLLHRFGVYRQLSFSFIHFINWYYLYLLFVGRFHPFIGHEGTQGEKRYSSTLFLTSALEWGEVSASRPSRTLPPGKTRYPLYRRLGGPQGRSGQVRKISPPTGIRSPDRPARRQSLYRLRYPAHLTVCYIDIISEWLEYCIYLRSISQAMPHQTYTSAAPTSRYQKILKQFELILSTYKLLFK